MIIYKNILENLDKAGYNTNRIRKEKIFSESTITRIRKNESISTNTLNKICEITGLPLTDIIEYKNNK